MNIWNDMMYIHRNHVVTMDEDEILFYTHFYDMLTLTIAKGMDNPLHTDVIQSLLRSAILALCGAMKQKLSLTTEHHVKTSDNHFQRFLDLLHYSEIKRHTVESYASELCISSKYLTAVCKKNSGKTANEWITEHVLEDIRYYLKQTDLSIKQICYQLGFPNPSFFGKYVKDHFGMTPMEFRNS
jgi:AraC-like DNA-binding protein